MLERRQPEKRKYKSSVSHEGRQKDGMKNQWKESGRKELPGEKEPNEK